MLKSIGVLAFLFYNIDATEMWWDAFLSSSLHSKGGKEKMTNCFKKAIILIIIARLLLMLVS